MPGSAIVVLAIAVSSIVASGSVASDIEVLAEERGVQLATRQHRPPPQAHQSSTPQPPEQPLVPACLIANDLDESLNQIIAVPEAEEVVSQMIAERAMIGGRFGKELGGRR